ncbi:MAG: glycosyltransferase family 2 protein [Planctomycetota bacterium]|nr:glycosyltransferase family 2 protein [Planctomycetota bacterium]
MASPLSISVVVPVFDEEDNLRPLHAEVARALDLLGEPAEVVYVDDGSRDRSLAVLLEIQRADPRVRVVQFTRNSGQTAAMAAGFDHARGEVVITLDADMQNDPADIPRLVAELRRGFDVVAGWRKERHDGFVLRRLPSLVANRLIAFVTGVAIHDTGCTLKAFRREVVQNLLIYAEQHRFLPAMAAGSGARVTELVVNHRARRFGRSKYGIGRATRVLLDLMSIQLIAKFSHRPMQFFGLIAAPFAVLLAVFLGYCAVHADSIHFDNAWGRVALITFMLLFMVCAYFLMLGFLAELAVRASGLHGDDGRRLIVSGHER